MEPDLLLLDEPFSELDDLTRLTVADDIWKIIRKEETTALLITNDIPEAVSMADRVIVLSSSPGTVKRIIDIQLPRDKSTPSLVRNLPEFMDYVALIKEELE
jgi:NitT/TauT family transport system ATP-binding protein